MCTYIVERAPIVGSAKGAKGWMSVDVANVFYDHPVHVQLEHSLNIDFVDSSAGPSQRVAVELSPDSARALVSRILAALQSGEAAEAGAAAASPAARAT